MKHARSIVAILLITIFTLTLLPLPALAEAIQPYESVEHLEEDVSIYHNKDGSETLVVEAVPSEGSANMKSDRLQDTGTALVGTGGDAQVQKNKQVNDVETLVTAGTADMSVSSYPVVQDVAPKQAE